MHQNIQGLTKKTDEIEIHIEESQPSILCFSEHWLCELELPSVEIKNYELRAAYCRKHLKRGGSCIFSKESFKMEQIELPNNLCVEQIFECCGARSKEVDVVVYCVYRSCCSLEYEVFFERLNLLLEFSLKKFPNSRMIIGGDFNIDLMRHTGFSSTFKNILHAFNLSPNITRPTRITANSGTCIDNICTNFDLGTIEPEIVPRKQ